MSDEKHHKQPDQAPIGFYTRTEQRLDALAKQIAHDDEVIGMHQEAIRNALTSISNLTTAIEQLHARIKLLETP